MSHNGSGSLSFDVGLFKRDKNTKNGGKMMVRTWTAEEIINKNFKFLQAKNFKGEDIFIRPARDTNSDLILIDDLEYYFIDQLIENKIFPAVITETSPENHQCWLKTGITDQKLKLELSRLLAEKYEGDPASVDTAHFGRLAGFTNQKQKYNAKGRQPFVLLRKAVKAAKQQESTGLSELINIAQERIDTAQAQHKTRLELLKNLPKNKEITQNLIDMVSRFYQVMQNKYSSGYDASRADWMLCIRLYHQNYTVQQVSEILAITSDTERKSNAKYYIDRTIKKSFAWHHLKLKNPDQDFSAVRDRLYELFDDIKN